MNVVSTVLLVVLTLAMAGLFAALPRLVPKGEYFAYKVSQSDAYLEKLTSRYTQTMLIAGLLAAGFLICGLYVSSNDIVLFAIQMVCLFLPIIIALGLFVSFHGRVARHAEAKGLDPKSEKEVVFLSGHLPKTISPLWCITFLVPILLSALFLWTHYDVLLSSIPMHISFSGVVQTVPKTPFTAALPVWIEAFFAVVFTFTVMMIRHAKRPVDPEYPELSAYAYASFARAQSLLLVGMGFALISVVGFTMTIAFAGAISMFFAFCILVIAVLCILLVVICVSFAYGQNGSRLLAQLVSKERTAPQSFSQNANNKAWKAGLIYWNSDDSAVIVPKRFGIGWTINLARPSAWVLLLAFTGIIVGFCILISLAAA